MNGELLFWQKHAGRPQCFFFLVDSRFINDSDEFGKMFVARIELADAFKKTNKMLLCSKRLVNKLQNVMFCTKTLFLVSCTVTFY